jgi:transcriptional regulator with GAF, ATPase, and Fis domain
MSPVQAAMHDLDAVLLYPLESEVAPIGLILLGKKKNSLAYTAEDLTFLHAMSQVTAIALHSARANQNMTRLNEALQHKVERIAVQRREIATLRAELVGAQSLPDQKPSTELAREFHCDTIEGNSPAIRRVLHTVSKVAATESTVLIRGESGTGKELLARVLHNNSTRSNGPLISVSCAALSSGLLESELFGHVKGSFTGAESNKIGRFEAANGGTLFLDEIGDINLETQVKLLRVLQERCFEPVGGSRTIHTDVRLVTATHQNLEKLIADGRFREDLYYRLNVISLTLPALRERTEDLIGLAVHFSTRTANRIGKVISRIDDEALAVMEQYSWPGNIRELENVIERAVVLAESDCITIDELPVHIVEQAHGFAMENVGSDPVVVMTQPPRLTVGSAGSRPPREERDRAERQLLLATLTQCNGNKAEAARKLGLPRSTLYSKVKKYGLG